MTLPLLFCPVRFGERSYLSWLFVPFASLIRPRRSWSYLLTKGKLSWPLVTCTTRLHEALTYYIEVWFLILSCSVVVWSTPYSKNYWSVETYLGMRDKSKNFFLISSSETLPVYSLSYGYYFTRAAWLSSRSEMLKAFDRNSRATSSSSFGKSATSNASFKHLTVTRSSDS